jgi:predicted O-methyltransferase YrrM
MDPRTGLVDTLPTFRRVLHAAGLENTVIAIVGRSSTVASVWSTPLGMLFIDGGHTVSAAWEDYGGWARHVVVGGLLAIHDVFPDPADGGQAPHGIYRAALATEEFMEEAAVGSLRLLRRKGAPPHARRATEPGLP